MNYYILLIQSCFIWSIGVSQWATGTSRCGQISRSKRTVLEQPSRLSEACSYTIEAYNDQVCQLLLQFEIFKLQQPVSQIGTFVCEDRLNIDDFTLCGDNTGQHLHITFPKSMSGRGKRQLMLNFNLSNLTPGTQWKIVATQLECPHSMDLWRLSRLPGFGFLQNIEDTTRTIFPPPIFGDLEHLAPTGCHQYYSQPTGSIRSFNFNATSGTLYMPNMKYTICIKSPIGAGKIEYNFRKFSMSIARIGNIGFDAECHATVTTPGRPNDFLMIPQAELSNVASVRPTFFCGRSLNGQQVSASSPFIIYFESDDMADPIETGFSIDYMVKSA